MAIMGTQGHTITIYHGLAQKRYLGNKHVYKYERIYVPIPRKLHHKIKPFLNQRLHIDITTPHGTLIITLHPTKPLSHTENPPTKTPPNTVHSSPV